MRDQARKIAGPSRQLSPAPARRLLNVIPRAALLLDGAIMIAVGVLSGVLRTWFGWFDGPFDVDRTLWATGPAILVGWIAVIAALGGYRERLFGAGVEEYKIVIHASLLMAGLTGVASFLTQSQLSRSYYVLIFSVGVSALVVERALLRRALHRARRAGVFTHDVVIAGSEEHVDEIAAVLSRETWLGYRVLGALLPPGTDLPETRRGTPVLGSTDETLRVLGAVNANVIFVASGALDAPGQMRQLLWDLERVDVRVVVAPSVTDVSRERIRIRPVGGLPLVHIDPPRHARARRRAKRVFDLVLTTSILVASLPVLAAIAFWVKLHDGGPVFFRQVRTGRDGEPFECLKFRTMVVDAEDRLAEVHAAEGYDGVGLFKAKDDPRITGPGRLLRRYSLDELPQLLNVLRGDMCLVGPRPPLPTEVATYDRFVLRRLHVRPGITGLWQVSGRSDLSWSEAVRLDLYYVDNWSMLQDLSILLKTLGAVTRSRGAY